MIFLAFDGVAIVRAAVPFLSLLLILVLIHEFGHFLAAKAFGIKVLEFGIGFPPKAKTLFTKGDTEYTLNWLPIGGFVRLLGEEDPTDPRSLAAAPRWQRLTVMGAGVMMNFALAIILLSVGYMIPRDRSLSQAQIFEVADGSPAAMAKVTGEMRDGSAVQQGIQVGDIIIEVEGRDIENTNELIFANRLNLGETQDWTIVRAGSTLEAEVYARWHPPEGQGPTGVRIGAPQSCSLDENAEPVACQLKYPGTESQWYWPWEAFQKGTQSLVDTMVLTVNEIRVRIGGGGGASIGGEEQPAFTGPVGIADTTGTIIDEAGWRPLIEFAALLSLNLAIFNALPIPMLDGGRMLFVVIEILRGGRRIAPEKEAFVHFAGFALMMAGVIVVTYLDIARLVS